MRNHHVVIPPWLSKQHFFFNPQRKDSIKGLSFIQQFEKQRNALLQNVWKFNNTFDFYTIELLSRVQVTDMMILGTTSSFHRSRLFSIKLFNLKDILKGCLHFVLPSMIYLLIVQWYKESAARHFVPQLLELVEFFSHNSFRVKIFIHICNSLLRFIGQRLKWMERMTSASSTSADLSLISHHDDNAI